MELLVALLVAAFGLAGLLRLFVESTRTAHRAQRLAQAELLGMGMIAEWQARGAEDVRAALAGADGVFPPEPVPFDQSTDDGRAMVWQWQWDEPIDPSQPLELTLTVSSDWSDPGETVHLDATL